MEYKPQQPTSKTNPIIRVVVIIAIIALGVGLYFLLTKEEVINVNNGNTSNINTNLVAEKYVAFGEDFQLKPSEIAFVKNTTVSLRITGFENPYCPPEERCTVGPRVNYELKVDDIVYPNTVSNLPYESHYNVFVRDTDYETYAVFMIDTVESTCRKMKSEAARDGCWDVLATARFYDTKYCYEISDQTRKNKCLTDVNSNLNVNSATNTNINQTECAQREEEIKALIDDMQYCVKDTDCIVDTSFQPHCPFGCYLIRNKSFDGSGDLSLILEKMDTYYSNCPKCVYGCPMSPEQKDIKCQNNKCIDTRL